MSYAKMDSDKVRRLCVKAMRRMMHERRKEREIYLEGYVTEQNWFRRPFRFLGIKELTIEEARKKLNNDKSMGTLHWACLNSKSESYWEIRRVYLLAKHSNDGNVSVSGDDLETIMNWS